MTKSNFNLETNNYLNNCDSKDVISLASEKLFYLDKLCDLFSSSFDQNVIRTIVNSINQKLGISKQLWLEDGEKCEILKAGSSGWQKGTIRLKINLCLEFIPDEPEPEKSPLDDLRQEINLNQTTN